MSWPIRFEGLNQCNNLTNANLPSHYFDQYNFALFFVVNSPINFINQIIESYKIL